MDKDFIDKNPVLTTDQDYAALRAKGLHYIEELSHKYWTDYNEHDPGITIMEALCYAITELGYRIDLPMQDLLTNPDGTIPNSQTLYTAKNILTQSPLTIDDYRKLLIDIVGVENAWLKAVDYNTINGVNIAVNEVPIYADCSADALSYNVTPHPVYFSGLYQVLLDLDDDDQLGDLNNGEVQILNPAFGAFTEGEVSFTIVFPVWNDPSVEKLLLASPVTPANVSATFSATGSIITAEIKAKYSIGSAHHTITLNPIVNIDLQPADQTIGTTELAGFFTPEFTAQVVNLYLLKIQKANHIVKKAIRKLNENRNLCEDFVSVTTIIDEEIAFCCDIEISPSTDMSEVQAEVFFAIEEYLNPPVNFYLLSEMQAMGYTTDEIFSGPVLKHGFIDTVQLEQTQLKTEIYASEIISLIMNIEGVLAVRSFRMTKYGVDDQPVSGETNKSWCMPITLGCKPVFSETKSKMVFYKNQFPYLPNMDEVNDVLRWLRATRAHNKLSGHVDDIAIPSGTYFPLDSYTSIEELFPVTYGIGQPGLPPTATNQQRAQAKQLQAYLLLYDQLLADFLSQLANAKELFSTDATVQTYYAQFIDSVKNIMLIYKQDSSAKTINELVMQNQDSATTTVNDWQTLYETNELFLNRRNSFLDHLMSRFAESFNEYVLLMYSLDYTTQQETGITLASMIEDKIEFLQDYPVMSYERGRAYNYFPQKHDFKIDTAKLWNTDNVAGVERKLSHLGGFKSNVPGVEAYFRRFLYCIGNASITSSGTPAKYSFVFTEGANTLTSVTSYDSNAKAQKALPAFMDLLLAIDNYAITQTGTNWNIYVVDNNGVNQAISNNFTSEADAETAMAQFITTFSTMCDSEGLHLIEHILLRPRDNTFDMAPVCLDPQCDFCGDEDPYSFRMSVVMPYWPAHFRSMAFREYFEDIVRQEVPAHTIVKVCWINDESMYEFEREYKTWITALANYSLDKVTGLHKFEIANNKLLKLLFSLHSEYPVATLHDCEDSQGTNPVQLGKTVLGSYKT